MDIKNQNKINRGTKDHPYASSPPIGPTCCLRKCERLVYAESLLQKLADSFNTAPEESMDLWFDWDLVDEIEEFLKPEPVE